MSTSLADQLRRLALPQTTALLQDKKRASLLFDPKEAANLDRETVFELGLSGFRELKSLKASFDVFERTLFSVSSVSLERSILSKEDNLKLDKQIHKFLLLLSPYFLVKPAHKALEWLVHRLSIHIYNVDQLMMLILPYHETPMFVRVLQLMDLREPTNRWHWLHSLQKPGVPLPKSVLLKCCSKDVGLLKFICDTTLLAIKALKTDASTLSTLFAFYCTTLVGALEVTRSVTELQITHLMKSLLKGLSSEIAEFNAASLMIAAQLSRRSQLTETLLHCIVNKVTMSSNASLLPERVLLLLVLYQTQHTTLNTLPTSALLSIATQPRLITVLTSDVFADVNIMPLLKPLLIGALEVIQGSTQDAQQMELLADTLINSLSLNKCEAKVIIRCVIDTFNVKTLNNPRLLVWYSAFLGRFERQYATEFDAVVHETLTDQDSSQQHALKTILGFSDDFQGSTHVLHQLQHSNHKIRVEALTYVRENYDTLMEKDITATLLARLHDDSAPVVQELLLFPHPLLVQLFGTETLLQELVNLLWRCHESTGPWSSVAAKALSLICSQQLEPNSEISAKVLISLLAYLLPSKEDQALTARKILKSPLGKTNPFLAAVRKLVANDVSASKICHDVYNVLNDAAVLPSPELMKNIIEESTGESSSMFVYLSTLVLSFSLAKDSPPDVSNVFLKTVLNSFGNDSKLVDKAEGYGVETMLKCLMLTKQGILPLQGMLHCLQLFIQRTRLPRKTFESPWWLLAPAAEQSFAFLLQVHNKLITGYVTSKSNSAKAKYAEAMKTFLEKHIPSIKSQMLFTCYLAVGKLDGLLTPELQVRSFLFLQFLLKESNNTTKEFFLLSEEVIVPSLLIASCSLFPAVRFAALDCLPKISKTQLTSDNYSCLLHQLLERREELQSDSDQLSLAMYTSLSPDIAVQSLIKKSRQPHMARILDSLLRSVVNVATPMHVSGALLGILQHVNSVHVLESLVPLGINLLEEGKREGKLREDQTDVLHKILIKYGHDVSSCMKSAACWDLLKKTLADHQMSVCSVAGLKASCPATMAIDIISRDLFDAATAEVQQRLLCLVVEVCTDTDRPAVVTAAGRLFKRISLEAELILPYLVAMRDAKNPNKPDPKTRKIRRFLTAPTVEMLHTEEWRRGITLLELIQNKKKMQNVVVLLPVLFDILKKCLQFMEQAPVEYTKQLVLSCLLHSCQKLSPDGSIVPLPEGSLNVGLVVECIRATQNPQTHHHALLVLSHVAGMKPDQVLHDVMAIFTFIGSSVLRQDDAYSFQVIEKIVDSVIPILVRASDALTEDSAELSNAVSAVLRVFVDALLDIPEHRRLPLFEKLLTTLNAGRSLWLLICLVLESHVVRGTVTGDNQRTEFVLHLTPRFTPDIILATCVSLMKYVVALPTDKQENKVTNKKSSSGSVAISGLFDIERNSAKQLRHFKYSLATFLSSLLSSPLVLTQVAALSDDGNRLMEPLYRSMIEQMLAYIQLTSSEVDCSAGLPTAKYWRVMLNQGYDILDKVNALLPGDMFIKVIQGLLSHRLLPLRRKALELLNSRLHRHADLFVSQSVFSMLPHLVHIVNTIQTQEEEEMTEVSTEEELIQQTALLSIKLLAHHFAADNPLQFKAILLLVTDLACSNMPLGNLLASLVLCLAELCSCLKVNAIVNLSRFMPAMIAILDKQEQLENSQADMVLLSIVTALDKICESLPQFLSPYLKELLLHVSILSAKWRTGLSDSAKSLPVVTKLKSVRQKMAFGIPPRVLIPSLGACYTRLLAREEYAAIGPLLGILSESFSPMSSTELKQLPDLTSFFLNALTLRSDLAGSDLEVIAEVEGHVVDALVGLVLKLSETTFRPLYFSLFHWLTEAGASKDRAITFYRLSSRIAASLKGLFVLFAGHFLTHAAQLLTANNPSKTKSLHFNSDPQAEAEQKSELLVRYILETLHSVFLYDSINFITKERFDTLMQPIVDQLENTSGSQEDVQQRVCTLITPCIAQFAVAMGDDVLWKQLNYQVLLKARHNQPQVRLSALETLCSVAKKLGEDFLPLLPETIPFLAELLEDEEEVIERAAQKSLQDLEQVLGEPLQKYF